MFCNLCGAKQGVVAPAQTAPGVPAAPGIPGQAPGGTPMGQPYNPNAPVAAVAARPMPQSLKCNSCGAPMKPSAGLALVVCEYCGAVTTMGASGAAEVIQKHFMLEGKISNEQALDAGGHWLNKGILRRKVAERSELGQVTLKYVPYWIVPTSVVADFQGTKNVGAGAGVGMMAHGDTGAKKAAGAALFALTMAAAAAGSQNRNQPVNTQPQVIRVRDRIQAQYNIPIVGVRGYSKYQPEDGFQFQFQSKVDFDKRATGGVDVQSGDVTEAEAKAQAASHAHNLAEKEAKKRVDNLESIQVYPTMYDGELLHAPVWFMEYAHKGKAMYILIDGNSGHVMAGERPSFSLW